VLNRTIGIASILLLSLTATGRAAGETATNAGNERAFEIARKSAPVGSAMTLLVKETRQIHDPKLERETLDAFSNPRTCTAHRANLNDKEKATIIARLIDAGLLESNAGKEFPGGLQAGVFPPVHDDGTSCPHLPQPFEAAPGSVFGGHHSYPGGLAIHEAFNDISALSLGADYARVYGHLTSAGLPTIDLRSDAGFERSTGDLALDQDLIIAAPIWHDWGKILVFQSNGDGTEFQRARLRR